MMGKNDPDKALRDVCEQIKREAAAAYEAAVRQEQKEKNNRKK